VVYIYSIPVFTVGCGSEGKKRTTVENFPAPTGVSCVQAVFFCKLSSFHFAVAISFSCGCCRSAGPPKMKPSYVLGSSPSSRDGLSRY